MSLHQPLFLLLAFSSAALVGLGADRPQFEVATIRPNDTGHGRVPFGVANGKFLAENESLKRYISAAYGMPEAQVQGSDWIGTERFDVTGRLPDGAAADNAMLMLQALLEDRFNLQVHREMQEMNFFALTVGKSGSKLKPYQEIVSMFCPTPVAC